MKKELITISASTISAPLTFITLEQQIQETLSTHNLDWFNQGNALAILLSYGAAAGTVSLITKTAEKTPSLKGTLKTLGAITLILATFLTTKNLITYYTHPELGLLAATATAGITTFLALRHFFPEYPFDPHIKGQRLLTSAQVKQLRGSSPKGDLPHGADWIDHALETQHFLVMGSIGSGKTLWMMMCMAALSLRENELFIVFDPKPQFVPYLEAIGRNPIILNPLDTRRTIWNISADINDETTAITFASALIKAKKDDDFWLMAARKLLVSILMFLIRSQNPWDLRDVFNIAINKDYAMDAVGADTFNAILAEALTGTNEKHGANDFLLNLNYYLQDYKPIAALMHSAKDANKISLKTLIRDEQYDRTALVLGNDEDSRDTINRYNGLIFEMLVNYILALDENRDRRIWTWIDELASVSEYVGQNLSRFQEKCRSKGGAAFIATQSYPALVAKLGEHYTDQIIGFCKHIVVPGGVDGKTAEVLSTDYFGSVDVVSTEYGESKEYAIGSATPEEHEVTPTFSRMTRPLVRKEDLYSSCMPKTNPTNGLTGFFYGERPHFHTYSWQQVTDMLVQETDSPAYDRVPADSVDLELTVWTEEEKEKWELGKRIQREEILSFYELSDAELNEISSRADLPPDKDTFTPAELDRILIQAGIDILQNRGE